MGQPEQGDKKMATIYVSESATAEQFEEVKKLAEETVLRDINWSGAELNVDWSDGDYSHIDTTDEYAGATLLSKVNDILM